MTTEAKARQRTDQKLETAGWIVQDMKQLNLPPRPNSYLLIPSMGSAAIACWSGPDSERHDFVLSHMHIEVKTTRKSRAEHEISRLDQLNAPPGKDLLFVSIQLEETVGGTESLATQLDAVIDLLRSDAAALDDFMAKMVNVGWNDEMRSSGEMIRFEARAHGIYPVDETFPRLPETFSPPPGVVALKYTIDLANLPAWGMEEATQLVQVTAGLEAPAN